MTDLPGKAIHDYYFKKNKKKLFVHDTFGPKVEMPVSLYFRNLKEMPVLEKKTLELCSGKILDVGAGAGSHALELQKKGFDVYALEISPSACEVMNDRGLKNVICNDFFQFSGETFDTILLLMNGVGISSDIEGFRKLLKKSSELLHPNGKLIFDSSDINYMYEDIQKPNHYYGEVKCRYEYGNELTDWFKWLYTDQNTLKTISKEEGWNCDIVFEDEHDQFLAVLTR